MKLDWNTIKKPVVALAPMADMTDSPFSKIVKDVASPIIFREMVSSEAVIRNNEKTLKMTVIEPAERPVIQQIFGADPKRMAKASKIISEYSQPNGIDINMGCPVYKMTSNFNGAALMKDPKLASRIVKSVKKSISVPLSVKMRAGWQNHNECIEFAKIIEDAGADLITIHGRTKTQGYSGVANREVVAKVKQTLSIPVFYNGDIFTWQDYFDALKETNCDGALIARGALGNPWIFKQIEDKINGEQPTIVTLNTRIETVKKHFNLHLNHYGNASLPTFRKHLSWYFKGVPHFKQYKQKLMTTTDKNELFSLLDQIKNNS